MLTSLGSTWTTTNFVQSLRLPIDRGKGTVHRKGKGIMSED